MPPRDINDPQHWRDRAAQMRAVKVEAGPDIIARQLTCRACGGPLPGREGKFVIKYFLLRNAGQIQKWKRPHYRAERE